MIRVSYNSRADHTYDCEIRPLLRGMFGDRPSTRLLWMDITEDEYAMLMLIRDDWKIWHDNSESAK